MEELKAPDMDVAIEAVEVKSSNLAAVGYDAASETLEVAFKGGRRYRYGGVPWEVANPFGDPASGMSPGAYFSAVIRQFAGEPSAKTAPRYLCAEVKT